MQFKGSPNFSHQQADKIGVLVTNLGTPDAPTRPALKRYLKEFLSDPRVVETPRWLWWLILNLVILNIRPARSAAAYRSVWSEQGSPLLTHTKAQCEALREALRADHGDHVEVEFAMRYGNPSIASALDKLTAAGVRKLVVLPLYPQYSASTTASTFDKLSEDVRQRRWLPALRFITHYHDQAAFIDACAAQIERHWQQHGRADKLLFSYHGLPKRYLLNGDPYFCQCHKTSRLLAQRLGLTEADYLTTFQSRFGREEWLQPYTDKTLMKLPAEGTQSVQVFCPGFAADCLETLEEIAVENRDYFLAAGGQHYQYITALNSEAEHIQALRQIVNNELQGWQGQADNSLRQQLAQQLEAANL
ncbi:ferrochelatase [Idiomarina xiamenensis]|uniref:Ferrochelatase n=1 Tax=Idiomarina xiamenensis 10-D-4 TaxID=740709 RepID=K2K688_9GAMM|nr:ferrochelatase [Idiomarina xiamenensis]EKE82107.1 ferrochelatase [Idiomarina xiamenensis 10-D-4]